MAIKITGTKSLTLPSALGGDDTTFSLMVVAATRGIIVVDTEPGMVEISGITDLDLMGLPIVSMLLSKGADVLNYEVYFELESLSGQVPEAFPNRTYLDENNENAETIHTWETWGSNGDSHSPVQIGEKWYKSSSDAANLGQPIPASCWGLNESLTIKTILEFISIRDSNQE